MENQLETGTVVYYIVRSRARSGMSRRIDFYTIETPDQIPPYIRYLNPVIEQVTGVKNHRSGMLISGCGFNAALHVVNMLSQKLFNNTTSLRIEEI